MYHIFETMIIYTFSPRVSLVNCKDCLAITVRHTADTIEAGHIRHWDSIYIYKSNSILCNCNWNYNKMADCCKKEQKEDVGKKLEYDPKFNGPVRWSKRVPTDVLCILLFCFFWVEILYRYICYRQCLSRLLHVPLLLRDRPCDGL